MTKAHSIANKLNLSAAMLTLAAAPHTGIAATQVSNVGSNVAASVQQTQQTRHKSITVNGPGKGHGK